MNPANPSTANFSKWAVVGHKDDTGLGRMAHDARQILGFGKHLVVPSERLSDHPVDGIEEEFLSKDASEDVIRSLLKGLEGILFFERPA